MSDRRHPSAADEARLESVIESVLASESERPARDLTRAIMGELGYMSVAPAVAARARRRRIGRRVALLGVVALAAGVGLAQWRDSDRARHAEIVTLPEALGSEVGEVRTRLSDAMRGLRSVAERLERPAGGPAEGPAPESAAPRAGASLLVVPYRPADELEEHVDRSGWGPVA